MLPGLSGRCVNRVLTARIENGRVEKVLALDDRRGAPGYRLTREWADPSSRTNRAVQLDNLSSRTGQTPGT